MMFGNALVHSTCETMSKKGQALWGISEDLDFLIRLSIGCGWSLGPQDLIFHLGTEILEGGGCFAASSSSHLCRKHVLQVRWSCCFWDTMTPPGMEKKEHMATLNLAGPVR